MSLMGMHMGGLYGLGAAMKSIPQSLILCVDAARLVDMAQQGDVISFWHEVAVRNTDLFDRLEGSCSLYQCETSDSFRRAFEETSLPNSQDSRVSSLLNKIVGSVVLWPYHFLRNEDDDSLAL